MLKKKKKLVLGTQCSKVESGKEDRISESIAINTTSYLPRPRFLVDDVPCRITRFGTGIGNGVSSNSLIRDCNRR